MTRLKTAFTALSLALVPALVQAQSDEWQATLEAARGQTVHWNAWGGSTTTNAFIEWVGTLAQDRYGVTLEHVKLADTADAVTRVLAERGAGEDENGAIDLIWINGSNFAAMQEARLLYGPFAETLPNWDLVDQGQPVTLDFGVPTGGYESPWASAQVVFMYDTEDLASPLADMEAILEWAQANPGRFTYPQPPDFLGSTFLKQVLYSVAPDPSVLHVPVEEDSYAAATAPLWDYIDALTPYLWREGRAYPQSGPRQLQLMADDEIDLAISFSPGEASTAIANFELPDTVRTFVVEGGTIGNVSFVAIPYNSPHAAGAMVIANLLLDPEVQARALDPEVLGYGTVLDVDRLGDAERARFEAIDLGVATLTPAELGPALPEPHPSWMSRIEQDWIARYGVAN